GGVVAPLAAVLAGVVLAAGDDGAEVFLEGHRAFVAAAACAPAGAPAPRSEVAEARIELTAPGPAEGEHGGRGDRREPSFGQHLHHLGTKESWTSAVASPVSTLGTRSARAAASTHARAPGKKPMPPALADVTWPVSSMLRCSVAVPPTAAPAA